MVNSFISSYDNSSAFETEIAHIIDSCRYVPSADHITTENSVTKPKVRVVITVYNSEPYLRECLDSVVYQTLEDIEIILVYDKSTDASLDVLENYAKKYKNKVKIIKCSQKFGHGGA